MSVDQSNSEVTDIDFDRVYARYQELQQYVGWSDYDVQRVRNVADAIEPYLSALIDDFYTEIDRHPHASRVITGGREQVRRLKQTLLAWIRELFSGQYDRDYVARRWRIGWRHVEIGLAQVYTNASMSRLRSGLIQAVQDGWQGEPGELIPTMRALNRLVDLDLAIIDDAYQNEGMAAATEQLKQGAAERRQVEQTLQDREATLRAILQTAVDAIVTIDEAGVIESVNPAAERMFGRTADDFVGQNVAVLMPPPYCDEHDDYLARYLKTGEGRIIGIGREVDGRRKDGSTFPVSISVSEVTLGDRRLFTAVIRNLTEQKRTQEKLVQSERLAAIGQMIASLAHESRNALQRIQACGEMLELEIEGNQAAGDLVARIISAGSRLHQLFEEVQGYTAPIVAERSDCDLASTWREAWELLERQRRGRQARLREEFVGQELWCSADRFRLVQLFRILFDNALASCSGPIEIEIRYTPAQLSGQRAIQIAVRDNGPGLADEQRARIFEPFYTTKTHGTGLGMAIARRIVEAHGGQITVGNCPTPGTEILITLPREAR